MKRGGSNWPLSITKLSSKSQSLLGFTTNNKRSTRNSNFKIVTEARRPTNASEPLTKLIIKATTVLCFRNYMILRKSYQMTTSVTYQRFYINFISQDENTFLVVTIQSWKNFTNCLNALTCITSRSRLSNNITQCKLIWKIQIVRNARYAFVLLRWKLAAFDIK